MQDWIKSSIITFVAGFAMVVVPQINTITLDSLDKGVLVGLLFAGVRMGIKMVLEAFLLWYTHK